MSLISLDYIGQLPSIVFHEFSNPSILHLLVSHGAYVTVYDITHGRLVCKHDISTLAGHITRDTISSLYIYNDILYVSAYRYVYLFDIHDINQFMYITSLQHNQMVLTVSVIDSACSKCQLNIYILIGLANNTVYEYMYNTQVHQVQLSCIYECLDETLLYCMNIHTNRCKCELFIFSGTVFNDILYWKLQNNTSNCIAYDNISVYQCGVILELNDRTGSTFNLSARTVSSHQLQLASVSDDRAARLWLIDTKKNTYTLQHILRKHTARIFRCLITGDNTLITGGEDNLVCVWSVNTGELIQSYNDQNGAIWSIAYNDTRKLVAVGCGDNTIRLHTPNTKSMDTTMIDAQHKIRTICMNNTADILYIATNEHTVLQQYTRNNKPPRAIYRATDTAPITRITTNSNNTFLAIGTQLGTITLLSINSQTNDYTTISIDSRHKSSIQLLQFVNWDQSSNLPVTQLISTDAVGCICIWSINETTNNAAVIFDTFKLPVKAKITAACTAIIDQHNLLILGDSRGSVYLYYCIVIDPPILAYNRIQHIHGVQQVEYITLHNNHIYSCGRDGQVIQYTIIHTTQHCSDNWVRSHNSNSTQSTNTLQLIQTRTYSTEHINTIEYIWWNSLNQMCIAGYYGNQSVTYNVDNSCVINTIRSGGPNKIHQFIVDRNNECSVLMIANHTSVTLYKSSNTTQSMRLGCAHHSKQVNCIKFIPCNITLFVSASEDNTIKLFTVDNIGAVQCLHTIQAHTQAVKCMSVAQHSINQYIIWSGGSQCELHATMVDSSDEVTINCISLLINARHTASTEYHNTDLRYTALCSFTHTQSAAAAVEHYVIAGDSAGQLQLMLFHISVAQYTNNCIYTSTSNHSKYCILSLAHVLYNNDHIVVAGNTDGKLYIYRYDNKQLNLLNVLPVHQSGVNDITITLVNDSLHIITCGDDQSITCCTLNNSSTVDSQWIVHTVFNAHYSNIRSVSSYNNLIVTCAYDQHLIIWNIINNQLIQLSDDIIELPDVQSIDINHKNTIVIAGHGLQLCKYNTISSINHNHI